MLRLVTTASELQAFKSCRFLAFASNWLGEACNQQHYLQTEDLERWVISSRKAKVAAVQITL